MLRILWVGILDIFGVAVGETEVGRNPASCHHLRNRMVGDRYSTTSIPSIRVMCAPTAGAGPYLPVFDIWLKPYIVLKIVPVVRPIAPSRCHWQGLIPVLRIHHQSCAYLLQIAQAGGFASLLSRPAENREENRGENGDDCYDHEELDECEASLPHSFSPPFFLYLLSIINHFNIMSKKFQKFFRAWGGEWRRREEHPSPRESPPIDAPEISHRAKAPQDDRARCK